MKIYTIIFVALAVSLSCTNHEVRKDDRLVVWVVGEGVDPDNNLSRVHHLNRAQGFAMSLGIDAAVKGAASDEFGRWYTLKLKDDGGEVSIAKKNAKDIIKDPKVVCVIGHASSGTTKAAASIYAAAGIPLIMPIATSPHVNYNDETGELLRNCFRLPASDDGRQAPAVAYSAMEVLNASRVYLVGDISDDAGAYSLPLFNMLDKYLKPIEKIKVNRSEDDFKKIARKIMSHKADLVVFCGYGTTAQDFFGGLREHYRNSTERPIVLLTDGSRTQDLNTSGFEVYLTFPVSDEIDRFNRNFSGLNRIINSGREPTYEIYGFDAILILDEVSQISMAKYGYISRDAIMKELRNLEDFAGISDIYTFDSEGDNYFSRYYLYKGDFIEGAEGVKFKMFKELPVKELVKFRNSISYE